MAHSFGYTFTAQIQIIASASLENRCNAFAIAHEGSKHKLGAFFVDICATASPGLRGGAMTGMRRVRVGYNATP